MRGASSDQHLKANLFKLRDSMQDYECLPWVTTQHDELKRKSFEFNITGILVLNWYSKAIVTRVWTTT